MTRMSEPLDLTAWMTRWQMFPPPEGLILCAVSGGRDSVCLLDCLWKRPGPRFPRGCRPPEPRYASHGPA